MNTIETRRAELQSTYYFRCECEKCNGPEPLVEAAVCPELSCSKPCDIYEKNCIHCEREIPEEFQGKFKDARDFTAHHLQSMKTMACILLT